MRAIVTVKFGSMTPEYDEHGNIRKVAGKCPLSLAIGCTIACTDVYGKHHSYIEVGNNIGEIEQKAKIKFGHVTRIEVIEEIETMRYR